MNEINIMLKSFINEHFNYIPNDKEDDIITNDNINNFMNIDLLKNKILMNNFIDLITNIKDKVNDDLIISIIKILLNGCCILEGLSQITLCNALRIYTPISTLLSSSISYPIIPIQFHHLIYDILADNIKIDDPPYWQLSGSKDCYIQATYDTEVDIDERLKVSPNIYTVTMWVKLDKESIGKGMLLCRSRCTNGGLDIFLSDRLPDDTWKISIRIKIINNNRSTSKENTQVDTFQGRIIIKPDEFHLLSFNHSTSGSFKFYVNGKIELESRSKLSYRFELIRSNWMFGQGLKGKISSIACYDCDIDVPSLQLLCDMGQHSDSIRGVSSIPQSSFDTGHYILGY
jgi:hypothetical protein